MTKKPLDRYLAVPQVTTTPSRRLQTARARMIWRHVQPELERRGLLSMQVDVVLLEGLCLMTDRYLTLSAEIARRPSLGQRELDDLQEAARESRELALVVAGDFGLLPRSPDDEDDVVATDADLKRVCGIL